MTQPFRLPAWGTNPAYPVAGKEWDSAPLRREPNSGEVGAGFVPDGEFPAQVGNWLHGIAAEHLSAIVDTMALNFPTITQNAGTDLWTGHSRPTVAGVNGTRRQYICFLRNGDGKVARSADGVTFASGAYPSGSFVHVDDISGAEDELLLALESSTGKVWGSGDAGDSWFSTTNDLPSTGFWNRLHYSNEFDLWTAAGAGAKCATAPGFFNAGSLTWTTRVPDNGTFPTAGGVSDIRSPRLGESGHGVALLFADATSLRYYYTLTGIFYVSRNLGGTDPLVDMCWSESHGRWYLITAGGVLKWAATLDGAWTDVCQVASGGTIYKLQPWGRNVLILGTGLSNAALPNLPFDRWYGGETCVAYDGTVLRAFSPPASALPDGEYTDAVIHSGRLALCANVAGPATDLAYSLRVPWET
jgi:hypothetical protein